MNTIPDLTKGAYIRNINKGIVPAILLALYDAKQMNPIAQFSVNNPLAVPVPLIIGSVLAETGAYLYYGTQPSAADNAAFSDQFGMGTPFITGFSKLTSHMPVVFNQIKISSANQLQVNSNFTHNTICPTTDNIYTRTNNIGVTQNKNDYNLNISVAQGKWVLGPNQYIQYVIQPLTSATIYLKIISIANVKSMVLVN